MNVSYLFLFHFMVLVINCMDLAYAGEGLFIKKRGENQAEEKLTIIYIYIVNDLNYCTV